ncbi:hypothetical protein [Xylella fastidiosa]|uniref:hypothetical protein n=1 Tax=Xylella fastidiosa TaxID=2371 RepID=UPI00398503AF
MLTLVSKARLTRERMAGRDTSHSYQYRIYRYSNQIIEEHIQQCRNVQTNREIRLSRRADLKTGIEHGECALDGQRRIHRTDSEANKVMRGTPNMAMQETNTTGYPPDSVQPGIGEHAQNITSAEAKVASGYWSDFLRV